MKRVTSARPFAKALLSVAKEHGAVKEVEDDLLSIRALKADLKEFSDLLLTALINKETKKKIVKSILEGKVSPITLGFLEALLDKHGAVFLDKITDMFGKMVDEEEGRIEAVVTSAVEMEQDTIEVLTRQLKQLSNKEVAIKTIIDPSIQGGMIVKLDDMLIDGSVRTQLARIQERLTRG